MVGAFYTTEKQRELSNLFPIPVSSFMNRFREKYRMIVGGVRLRSKYQRRRLLACSTVNNKHGSKMFCPNKSNGLNV